MQRSTQFNIEKLTEFDAVIDVRTPAEYAEDHIPGAVNLPVLTNEERVEIGTIYKQVSAFQARKRGAGMVAANIARHLQSPYLAERDRPWNPLVYCWRGGKRSGAMAHVLREVGWNATQLVGGYKTYRSAVIEQLGLLPANFAFRVVCGETGSGKSRLLRALGDAGAQVLDLEDIARHRGSVLGSLPNRSQPSQKAFDTALWHALSRMDQLRPVFVEAESKRIGDLRVPDALMQAMRSSPCIQLVLPFDRRLDLLLEEYQHFFGEAEALFAKLDSLTVLHGKAVIAAWKQLAAAGKWRELTAALLTQHYDPAYRRSTAGNFPALSEAIVAHCRDAGAAGIARTAAELLISIESAETPA
jgi:tRNA 2-selenouridine synthase